MLQLDKKQTGGTKVSFSSRIIEYQMPKRYKLARETVGEDLPYQLKQVSSSHRNQEEPPRIRSEETTP